MMWDCKVRWAGLIVGIVASTAACKRSEAVPDEPVEVVQEQETANSDAEEAGDAGDETDTSKAGDEVEPEDESAESDDGNGPQDAKPEEEAADEGYSWTRETLGPLRRGMSAQEAEAALGAPDSKTPPEEVMATGDILAFWRYPDLGVWLAFAHEREDPSSPASLRQFSIDAPSTFKTSRGIGIGSSFSSVVNAYKNANDPDQDEDVRSIVRNDERILVGSIYGGMDISFENERVTSIFIGAGAE